MILPLVLKKIIPSQEMSVLHFLKLSNAKLVESMLENHFLSKSEEKLIEVFSNEIHFHSRSVELFKFLECSFLIDPVCPFTKDVDASLVSVLKITLQLHFLKHTFIDQVFFPPSE